MPNQQFEDLARVQSETVRALQLLSSQLGRSRDAGDATGAPGSRVTDQPVQPSLAEASGVERASGQTPSVSLDGIVRHVSTNRPADEEGIQARGDTGVQNALGRTTRAVQSLTRSLGRNTQTLDDSSKSIVDGIRGVFGSLVGLPSKGSGGLGFFGGGLGLASLGLKIAGLFRGDREDSASLTPFGLPPGIDIEATNTDRILAGFPRVVRDQNGQVRTAQAQPAPTPIVVNISAMDSQSFLDRSSDIAQAVRDAMLHMHPLNDMIREV